ncbi:MAG: hypothetical protein D3916_00760 [Candidatus Electrothrix sp. MAN1_4]|nr:hypothetical protein [Candidatus Electrothrix sp. MAN1_4]
MKLNKKFLWETFVLFCAVIALLAVITSLIFSFKSPWINKLDKYIVESYKNRYSDRLQDAEAILPQDRANATNMLQLLLEDLSAIKYGDRLAPVKQKCFVLLSQIFHEDGQINEALSVVEEWVKFNDRDLNALTLQGELLLSLSAREDEGASILTKLFGKVPEAEVVAKAYIHMLQNQGRMLEAFRALSQYMNTKHLGGHWRIYWDSGVGFNEQNSKTFFPEIGQKGILTLGLELNFDIKRLRIDPPPFSALLISNPVMLFNGNGKKYSLQLAQLPLQFHHMIKFGNRLKTSGGNDPYFIWQMSEKENRDPINIIVKAEVNLWVPDSMKELAGAFSLEELKKIKLEPLTSQEKEIISNLELLKETERIIALQRKAMLITEGVISVYWIDPPGIFSKQHFSEQRTSKVPIVLQEKKENLEFDLLLPVNAKVEQLRIDFPDVVGIQYHLKQVELISGEHKKLIDISTTPFLLQHKIEKDGQHIKVTGPDPHFSFDISNGASQLDYVRLVGEVQ